MIPLMSDALVILGCTQRKRRTSRLLPAIERYDGPTFRVLRKFLRDAEETADAYVLSSRFGLIAGDHFIPYYERQLPEDCSVLRGKVEHQLKRTLDDLKPERLFVCLGMQYWELLEAPLTQASTKDIFIASGGIGGRASQLAQWLRHDKEIAGDPIAIGEATLLGKTMRLTQEQILAVARSELRQNPTRARRFETWYVPVERDRVAPKWLVSVLFNKPVAAFRTADARRVLSSFGVDCLYASHH